MHIKNIFGVGSVNKGHEDFFYANGSFKSNSVTVDFIISTLSLLKVKNIMFSLDEVKFVQCC